jgi:hypothetical protein
MKDTKQNAHNYIFNFKSPHPIIQNPFLQEKTNNLINKIISKNAVDLRSLEKSNEMEPSNDLTRSPIKLLNIIYHKKQENQKGLSVPHTAKQFLRNKVLNNEVNDVQTRHIRSISMKRDPNLEEHKSLINSRETTPKINKNNISIISTQKTKEMERAIKKNSFHEKSNLDETERKEKFKNLEKINEKLNREKIDFKIFSKNIEKIYKEPRKSEVQKQNEEKEKRIQRIIMKQKEDQEGNINDEIALHNAGKNYNFEPFINLLNLKNLNEKMHLQMEKLSGKAQNNFSSIF